MVHTQHINSIIQNLLQLGVIDSASQLNHRMHGTTDGLVHTLTVHEEPKYVLKLDSSENISMVREFYSTYEASSVLPNLYYTDPAHTFIVYSYIKGTTHYNRGSKINWLSLLVTELLNHYQVDKSTKKWGSLVEPCHSWHEFNERGLENARRNLDNLLPTEDYYKVKSLLENTSKVTQKYLLHGDTGVHNFVFNEATLTGVIDPSPVSGPLIYDFAYAFCSSPDDLNLDTLFTTFDLLHEKSIEKSRLIEEVIFQLYCRIGVCAKVHPHDLKDYLKAWDYWKTLIPSL